MHVSFDYTAALRQSAGIGRYGREMLPRLRDALAPDTVGIFANGTTPDALPADLAAYPRWTVPWSNKTWRVRVALDYLLGRDRDVALPGVDCFFAADHLLPRCARFPRSSTSAT